jgi:Zn ribbon nucleic-acid-binding protein
LWRDNEATPWFLKFSLLIAHFPDNQFHYFHHNIIMATMAANPDRDVSQPTCQNCTTSTTPLWRRDEIGSVLCNACGLFLKLHGRPRPISLKTDVIKSRNRVKSSSAAQNAKKKVRR